MQNHFCGADLKRILGCMECAVWYFVSGDVHGYFAGCFSKVEDDVVYYNGADQKKKSFACRMFFLPLFYFALMDVYMDTRIK